MGIFSKFKSGLKKGAVALEGAFSRFGNKSTLSEEDLLELEEAFYGSDFGVETTEEILEGIRMSRKILNSRDQMAITLAREVLLRTLQGAEVELTAEQMDTPEVVCLVGVNGSGKRQLVPSSLID